MPKDPKPLSGKEIIEAAQNGVEVRYTYTSYNEYARDRDLDYRVVPELTEMESGATAVDIDEDETGCFWEVPDLETVSSFSFELDEGIEAIYPGESSTVKEQLREKLAKFIHEDLWAHWMKYLFSKTITHEILPAGSMFMPGRLETIKEEDHTRWKRQMATLYEDLSEDEKKSDQELAEKLMKLLEDS